MSLNTIERLYDAFARLDGEAMQACYAPDAQFDDPVFSLRGAAQIGGMWRMLCDAVRTTGAAHWRLDVRSMRAEGGRGSAHWKARYRFSATGRRVLNRVDAEFEFDEQGRITRHHDHFGFWAWSRQALGTPGWLLGWTPWLRRKVRRKAASSLQRFLA